MIGNHLSLLGEIDQFCGQFATALQRAEFQVYVAVALIILLSALLFPPRDDLDQI